MLSFELSTQVGCIASFEVRIDMWTRRKDANWPSRYMLEAEEVYKFLFLGNTIDELSKNVCAGLEEILTALSDQQFWLRDHCNYFGAPLRHASAFTADLSRVSDDALTPGYVFEMVEGSVFGVMKLLEGAVHYGKDPSTKPTMRKNIAVLLTGETK
jgi:hypothetical protein